MYTKINVKHSNINFLNGKNTAPISMYAFNNYTGVLN